MARRGPWGEAPVAGATPPVPPGIAQQWHIAEDGAATGPFSAADLRQMAATGSLTGQSWVWTPGSAGWRHAAEVPEIAALLGQVPPPPPAA
jgi:hypothetical protein